MNYPTFDAFEACKYARPHDLKPVNILNLMIYSDTHESDEVNPDAQDSNGQERKGLGGLVMAGVHAMLSPTTGCPHLVYSLMSTIQRERAVNVSARHADGRQIRDHEFRERLQEQQQEFQLNYLKTQILEQQQSQQRQFAHQYDLQKDNQDFQLKLSKLGFIKDIRIHRERMESEENREVKRQYVQWRMQQHQQDFTATQAQKAFLRSIEQDKLRNTFQRELEKFRQACSRGNLEWQFEQRKQLDWQLKQFDRETQMMVCNYHRENIEYQRIIDSFPLLTQTEPIRRYYRSYCADSIRPVPPLVIFSPPEVKVDRNRNRITSTEEWFIAISQRLEVELSDFIKRLYPLSKPESSPVYTAIRNWKSKEISLDAAETYLYDAFSLFPVIFIESNVIRNPESREDDIFHLRVLQWDAGSEASDRPFGDISLPWKALQNISNFLSKLHQICAGLSIDEYYLFHYNRSPKLSVVLKDLLQDLSQDEAKELMSLIVARYRTILERIQRDCPSRVPELALKVAESLSYLPDQAWARDQVEFSNRALISLMVDFDAYKTPDLEFEVE